MNHAEWLIQRILFLERVVSKLNPMKIGKSVLEMVSNDQEAEVAAVRAYNASIRLGPEVQDQATADWEEGHVDWAEQQRAQIEQMGLENYLTNQMVTAIINPSDAFSWGYPKELITKGDQSAMPNFNDTLTIHQLIDLVAFLQSRYELLPPMTRGLN
jgi:Ferritin-like domain